MEVLATLQPDCYVFDKGYMPGSEEPAGLVAGITVDNTDGFYTGLPMLAGKSKSSHSVVNRLAGSTIDDKIARANASLLKK